MGRKFDVEAVYTKANFIAIFQEVKAEIDPNHPFIKTIDENIAWAEKHHDDTIFEWKIQPNGVILPEASVWLKGKDVLDKLEATE